MTTSSDGMFTVDPPTLARPVFCWSASGGFVVEQYRKKLQKTERSRLCRTIYIGQILPLPVVVQMSGHVWYSKSHCAL